MNKSRVLDSSERSESEKRVITDSYDLPSIQFSQAPSTTGLHIFERNFLDLASSSSLSLGLRSVLHQQQRQYWEHTAPAVLCDRLETFVDTFSVSSLLSLVSWLYESYASLDSLSSLWGILASYITTTTTTATASGSTRVSSSSLLQGLRSIYAWNGTGAPFSFSNPITIPFVEGALLVGADLLDCQWEVVLERVRLAVMGFMTSVVEFLPQTPGLLPKWQLLVATTALLNTVQCFLTLKFTRKLYNAVPAVTPLQARTFAVWTLTSSIVRFYAAYHITDKTVYDLTLFTYLIAFGHFASELLIFRTAKLAPPVLSPVIVSTTSLIWMLTQYDFYVRS